MRNPPAITDVKKQTPRWVWVVVGLGVAMTLFYLAVPLYIFGSTAIKERLSRIAFSSETWKQAKPSAMNDVRLSMVDDLMKSRTLNGKNRGEVVELLGEPDGDPAVRPRFPSWQMHYYLGPSRGTVLFKGFDFDYLVLRLDSSGKVVATDIVTLRT
jgi:hypothetical protein